MKTLKEVCSECGVTRRTIQGYEEMGLVIATEKNKYGHLLYDQQTRERISKIRLYQQLGFSKKEIKDIIDAPNHVVKAALEKQLLFLKQEQEMKELLIEKVNELLKTL